MTPAGAPLEASGLVRQGRRRLRQLALLLRSGRLGLVLRTIRRRLYSDQLALGLRLDTTGPLRTPKPPLALTVRPIAPEEVPLFGEVAGPGVGQGSVMDRVHASYLLESGVQTCYVAVTAEGHVCYMQFLIDPSQNARIRALYGDLMPTLEADEALLEAAFSLERYRGRGIMLHIVPELARLARERGLRWLIAFVATHNAPMLRGCQWAGFQPYVERRESHRLFHRRVRFTPLSASPRAE